MVALFPVSDIIHTGDILGTLFIYPNKMFDFTNKQETLKSSERNTFLFIGNNLTYFSHLVNNRVYGTYNEKGLLFTTRQSMAYTHSFYKILQYHIKYINENI